MSVDALPLRTLRTLALPMISAALSTAKNFISDSVVIRWTTLREACQAFFGIESGGGQSTGHAFEYGGYIDTGTGVDELFRELHRDRRLLTDLLCDLQGMRQCTAYSLMS